jgi:hypothetical protein
VAIGGNFLHAKIKVWSPGGRGVGVRRPIVDKLSAGCRLDVVRRKKIGRLIMLGRKAIGAEVKEYFQKDVIGVGRSSVPGFKLVKDGEEMVGERSGREAVEGGDSLESSVVLSGHGSKDDGQIGDVPRGGEVDDVDGSLSTDTPQRREEVQESIGG